MRFLRQSTASQEILLGPFVAAADGSAQTGLTIANTDIKLLPGGATSESNKNSGGGTHIAGGRYSAVLDATDTATVGILEVSCNPASGIPWNKSYYVLEEAVYDALFAASAPGYGTAQTGDSFARIGATGSGLTSLATQASVNTIDDLLDSEIGALTTELAKVPKSDSNVTWNATALASINTQVDTGISDAALATAANLATVAGYLDTEIAAILADTNELQTDWVNGGRLDLILDARASQASVDTIDNEVGAIDTVVDAIKVTTDKLDDTLEDDAGTFRFTTNALEQAPSGGGGVADWDADERTAIRSILGIPASGTTPDDPSAGILDTIRDAVATRASQSSVDTIDDLLDTEVGALATELAKVPKSDGSSTWNATALASLQQEATDALNAYDPPTKAELDAGLAAAGDATLAAIAALNNLSSAQAQTAAAAALTAYDPPTRAEATSDKDEVLARLPDALVGGSMKANITHVIGDPVQESGSTTTAWGGAP